MACGGSHPGSAICLPPAFSSPQFNPSKAFAGGADGVRQLAKAVDLGRTLVLRNVDVESLEAAEKVPVPMEVDSSRRTVSPHSSRFDSCGCRFWPYRGDAAAAAVAQQEEALAPADRATAGDLAELEGQPSWRQVAAAGADAV